MTGNVINLRNARKLKAREQKAAEADARRLEFGRTKAEKKRQATDADNARRLLDGHRREPSSDKT